MLDRSRSPRRAQVIATIRKAEQDERTKWFDDLIHVLNGVASDLTKRGRSAGSYLEMVRGKVDADAYEVSAFRQLDRHHAQSNNATFRKRLQTGFVFPRVPAFRGASAEEWSFDDFVTNFCQNLSRSAAKGRTRNKLVQRVRLVLREHGYTLSEMSGEDVRLFLVEHWNDRSAETGRSVGERVKAFYRAEKKHGDKKPLPKRRERPK